MGTKLGQQVSGIHRKVPDPDTGGRLNRRADGRRHRLNTQFSNSSNRKAISRRCVIQNIHTLVRHILQGGDYVLVQIVSQVASLPGRHVLAERHAQPHDGCSLNLAEIAGRIDNTARRGYVVKISHPDPTGQAVYGNPGHRRNLQLKVTTHELISFRSNRKGLTGINPSLFRLPFFSQFPVAQHLAPPGEQASRAAVQLITRQAGQHCSLIPHAVFAAGENVGQNTMNQNRAA